MIHCWAFAFVICEYFLWLSTFDFDSFILYYVSEDSKPVGYSSAVLRLFQLGTECHQILLLRSHSLRVFASSAASRKCAFHWRSRRWFSLQSSTDHMIPCSSASTKRSILSLRRAAALSCEMQWRQPYHVEVNLWWYYCYCPRTVFLWCFWNGSVIWEFWFVCETFSYFKELFRLCEGSL